MLYTGVHSPHNESFPAPFRILNRKSISYVTETEKVNVALSWLRSLISEYIKDKIIFTTGPGGPLGPVGPSFPVKPYSKTKA